MLIDRIRQLRLLLPAMAHETAVARHDNARLRVETKMLAVRVAELEAHAVNRTADLTRIIVTDETDDHTIVSCSCGGWVHRTLR